MVTSLTGLYCPVDICPGNICPYQEQAVVEVVPSSCYLMLYLDVFAKNRSRDLKIET